MEAFACNGGENGITQADFSQILYFFLIFTEGITQKGDTQEQVRR